MPRYPRAAALPGRAAGGRGEPPARSIGGAPSQAGPRTKTGIVASVVVICAVVPPRYVRWVK
ncbi:hypothetical protein FHX34_10672 [Actinoplanes teichomyceticus]|uniref:Uncharacterized protein n=1 Tax=Actinoplanes teichomyceticus TaxID=1867 RepID=A0A561VIA1_ACTTI|nr:hypothetical protein FHX34_10672 [Actinoplanes teichomyceticus]GIF16376.1 hypothetical protein Ate01nite_64080 [Actinoplanes teichomyceticus]